PLRFDTIKNRFFKPRSDVTIGTQLGALALVCSPPFVFFLFGLVNQTINLNWNTLALLFVPLVVLVPMILYIWSQQKRNTLTSEVGFCSHCGHQIPPGEGGELCLECGLAHHAENTPKSVIRKTPLLSWSIALFLALYIPWVVLMVATVNGGGIMRFTDKLGINVPAYLSTSMLVANAESDARGRSVAWTELQNRTLTTTQADRLAGTVLAYHEDP
ncbi:MAG: hypothetical protein GY888_07275, partial [Planctomycetaceae bacterium]|nr:hypothetical protein [Planctomycetaceae bacterium]